MAWTWRYEGTDGQPADPGGAGGGPFPSQSDAESWLGETWRALREAGVRQVVLLDGDREVYGPMSLDPA